MVTGPPAPAPAALVAMKIARGTIVPGSTREAGPWRWVMLVFVPTAFLVGYFSCLYEVLPAIVATEPGGIAIANLGGSDYVGGGLGGSASSTELPIELPDRVIAVFGLESSGTTFVTAALKAALGAVGKIDLHCRANRTELQHASLPWGWWRPGRPRGVSAGGGVSPSLTTSKWA